MQQGKVVSMLFGGGSLPGIQEGVSEAPRRQSIVADQQIKRKISMLKAYGLNFVDWHSIPGSDGCREAL